MEEEWRREPRDPLLLDCSHRPSVNDCSEIVKRLINMHGEEGGIGSICNFIRDEQLSETEATAIDEAVVETDAMSISPYSGYISWVLLRISNFSLSFIESLFERCIYDSEAEEQVKPELRTSLSPEAKQIILEVCRGTIQELSTGGKQLLERMWRVVIIYAFTESNSMPEK